MGSEEFQGEQVQDAEKQKKSTAVELQEVRQKSQFVNFTEFC